MRTLVLAAVLAALAGCSMPYEGTSFAALPKPEHMAEGERHETEDHDTAEGGEAGAKEIGIASKMYSPDTNEALATNVYGGDKDDVFPGMGTIERTNRAGSVFPKTAQPSKAPIVSQNGYRTDAMPSASTSEGE